ncbi:hypothetical protein [Octadecabacter sp. SW4]|nr:hypothetical protein [Octadecabacter sp. SW4]
MGQIVMIGMAIDVAGGVATLIFTLIIVTPTAGFAIIGANRANPAVNA